MSTSQICFNNNSFRVTWRKEAVHHENLTHKINGCKILILVKAVEIEMVP